MFFMQSGRRSQGPAAPKCRRYVFRWLRSEGARQRRPCAARTDWHLEPAVQHEAEFRIELPLTRKRNAIGASHRRALVELDMDAASQVGERNVKAGGVPIWRLFAFSTGWFSSARSKWHSPTQSQARAELARIVRAADPISQARVGV